MLSCLAKFKKPVKNAFFLGMLVSAGVMGAFWWGGELAITFPYDVLTIIGGGVALSGIRYYTPNQWYKNICCNLLYDASLNTASLNNPLRANLAMVTPTIELDQQALPLTTTDLSDESLPSAVSIDAVSVREPLILSSNRNATSFTMAKTELGDPVQKVAEHPKR